MEALKQKLDELMATDNTLASTITGEGDDICIFITRNGVGYISIGKGKEEDILTCLETHLPKKEENATPDPLDKIDAE